MATETITCPTCGGEGVLPDSEGWGPYNCYNCSGKKVVDVCENCRQQRPEASCRCASAIVII